MWVTNVMYVTAYVGFNTAQFLSSLGEEGQKLFSWPSSTALAVGQERRPIYDDLSLLTCSCCACLSRVSIIFLVFVGLNVKDRFLLTAAPKVLLGTRCQRKVDWLR
jgi:hypothetical protein